MPGWRPNQALKLTRLSAGQLGGPGSAENAAAHWPCNPSAVQLNAGVRPPGILPLHFERLGGAGADPFCTRLPATQPDREE
jgi:hypothetical protein